jgi:uncharacterized protein
MWLKPGLVVPDVTHITRPWLEANGIKGFIFDLDNTLMKPHTGLLDERVAPWLQQMQADGYRCSVVSNNPIAPYIAQVEKTLGFPCLSNGGKPRRAGLKQALEWLGLPAHEVVVVGDRPLTDIWGGQRLGAHTVLVDALNKAQEPLPIKVLRKLERLSIAASSRLTNSLVS